MNLVKYIGTAILMFSITCCTKVIDERNQSGSLPPSDGPVVGTPTPKPNPLTPVDRYEELSSRYKNISPVENFEQFTSAKAVLLSAQQRISPASSLPIKVGSQSRGRFELKSEHEAYSDLNQIFLRKTFGDCEVTLAVDGVMIKEEVKALQKYLPLGDIFDAGTILATAKESQVFSADVFFSAVFSNLQDCSKALKGKKSLLGLVRTKSFTFHLEGGNTKSIKLSALDRSLDKLDRADMEHNVEIDWLDSEVYFLRDATGKILRAFESVPYVIPAGEQEAYLTMRVSP